MKESEIEKKVSAYAVSLGWLCYKFQSPGNRGVPDRIYFRNGLTVFIEFKAPGKKPTILQRITIDRLRNEGFVVWTIDDVESGKKAFNDLENCF